MAPGDSGRQTVQRALRAQILAALSRSRYRAVGVTVIAIAAGGLASQYGKRWGRLRRKVSQLPHRYVGHGVPPSGWSAWRSVDHVIDACIYMDVGG